MSVLLRKRTDGVPMNGELSPFASVLKDLITQYGVELLDDDRRFEALLRDVCRGERRPEIFLLMNSLRAGIVGAIAAERFLGAATLQRERWCIRLASEFKLTRDAAEWTVDTWAAALGVLWDNSGGLSSIDEPEDGLGITLVGISHHIEAFRVTAEGRVEHMWFPDAENLPNGAHPQWSGWEDFGFDHGARDVAATSGWPEHIELFVLAADGIVWHRWWWLAERWNEEGFLQLGQPFEDHECRAHAIAAASRHPGHMDVQVQSLGYEVRNIWWDDDSSSWKPLQERGGWARLKP